MYTRSNLIIVCVFLNQNHNMTAENSYKIEIQNKFNTGQDNLEPFSCTEKIALHKKNNHPKQIVICASLLCKPCLHYSLKA